MGTCWRHHLPTASRGRQSCWWARMVGQRGEAASIPRGGPGRVGSGASLSTLASALLPWAPEGGPHLGSGHKHVTWFQPLFEVKLFITKAMLLNMYVGEYARGW